MTPSFGTIVQEASTKTAVAPSGLWFGKLPSFVLERNCSALSSICIHAFLAKIVQIHYLLPIAQRPQQPASLLQTYPNMISWKGWLRL